MGKTRDFVKATLTDAVLSQLNDPIQAIVSTALHQQHTPTRQEVSKLQHDLKAIHDGIDATGLRQLTQALTDIEDRITKIEQRVSQLAGEASPPPQPRTTQKAKKKKTRKGHPK